LNIKVSRNYFLRHQFNWVARGVLRTPPLEPRSGEAVIVSMLCHRDVLMYLLAIKTFYGRLASGNIVIIDDGSLTNSDRQLLEYHVKPSAIVPARSLHSVACPGYISWKKLLCIANFLRDGFVIQLDSDTLTVGDDLNEVRDCVASGTSFILGTWANQTVTPMREAVAAARESSSIHVQMVAEQNFDQLQNYDSLKYVRGCSGFDGFSKDLFTLKDIEAFSTEMFRIIGEKWGEWGSEQTMSNVLVANAPRALALPYPHYYNYWGTEEAAKFIHFVGSYRYDNGVYARAARAALVALNRKA
jgi:hypothetical protein